MQFDINLLIPLLLPIADAIVAQSNLPIAKLVWPYVRKIFANLNPQQIAAANAAMASQSPASGGATTLR